MGNMFFFLNQYFYRGRFSSLDSFAARSDTITVSGVSSGGAMALQLHTIYSDTIKGSGMVVALPPGYAFDDALYLEDSATISADMIAKANA